MQRAGSFLNDTRQQRHRIQQAMAVRVRHVVDFRARESLLVLGLIHIHRRGFRVDVFGLKYFADAVDHQRDFLGGFDVDRAVLQRVVAFTLDADQKVARFRKG